MRTASVVTAVVLSTAVASCGGSDGATPATTSADVATTVPASTTSAPGSEEDAILAAVDGYWRTIREAWDPPDPTLPGFKEYFVGEARSAALDFVEQRRRFGHVVRLPGDPQYSHDPAVVEISGDVAMVADCSVDDSVLIDRQSGVVLDDEVVTTRWEIRLERDGGAWRVASLEQGESWEGEAGCAL